MTPGKAASQAGHAFLESFLSAPADIQCAYHANGLGTKVVLVAADEIELRRLHIAAAELGLPCALIIDQDHIMPPHFDGSPIVTALGIGPVCRDMIAPLTAGLPLMK